MGRYSSMIVIMLFVGVLVMRMQTQRTIVDGWNQKMVQYNRLRVHNIANGGVTNALNALTIDVNASDAATNVALGGGTYSYSYQRNIQDATLGVTDVRVTAIGKYRDLVDTVVVLLTRPSFSRYAYFTNQEGTIWFQTGDTLTGPVHTNTYFNMQGYPVFDGKVTSHLVYNSTNPYRKYSTGITSPSFFGGTEWQVPTLEMPTGIPADLKSAAQSGGMYIGTYTYVWMKFQSDGTVKVAKSNSSSTPSSGSYVTYNLSSLNGVFLVEKSGYTPVVNVEGTVNGQVTVASAGNIKVTGNLLLASNPATNPSSDDIAGLCAAKNIIVANNSLDADRTIQATCMTMNTTVSSTTNFNVENYSTTRYGTLHLLGGLIQQGRGAVGTIGTSTSRTGYIKDYVWDSRLQDIAPPYFPMLFVLRKISWYD
jgi:hypothetical protein